MIARIAGPMSALQALMVLFMVGCGESSSTETDATGEVQRHARPQHEPKVVLGSAQRPGDEHAAQGSDRPRSDGRATEEAEGDDAELQQVHASSPLKSWPNLRT